MRVRIAGYISGMRFDYRTSGSKLVLLGMPIDGSVPLVHEQTQIVYMSYVHCLAENAHFSRQRQSCTNSQIRCVAGIVLSRLWVIGVSCVACA